MRGFVLTPTYRVVHGVPEVHLHGVLESGEPCLIIDDRHRPHFFVRQSDLVRLRALAPKLATAPTDLRSWAGEPMARVSVSVPADVPPLRRRCEAAGVECFEADVRFAYRYLIDRGIRGAFEVLGDSHPAGRYQRVFRNPALRPASWAPRLKILSIDIETSMDGRSLYSIALHTPDFDRVILVHERAATNAESIPTEQAAIRRFLEYIDLLDPDVITGWNVVDFDLAFLAKAARRYGIHFAIGRTDDEFDWRKDASFTRESRAVIFGRQVLDGLALMRGAFIRLDDYRLETAAQTFLGRGKLFTGDARHRDIEAAYHRDPQRLVDYNLQDARLVAEILQRTGLIDLAVERSLLTGMQLDRVGAAIASIDSLYLNALRSCGRVAPSVHTDTEPAAITGGYVMESKPGLYTNVLVFDFKSLYPSIIRTFNIDPITYLPEPQAGVPVIRAPNGACFRRDRPGIIPQLLTDLAAAREAAKRAGNSVKSNAIKILMNSFYGVLGAGASRLFLPPVANAVTHFGQYLIRCAAAFAEGRGYRVLYGDTDSLFIEANVSGAHAAVAVGEALCAQIGAAVAERIHSEFAADSVLELEFEKLYHRFFLPEVRSGITGSKKRYAGLVVAGDVEEIEFVGLEAVRRDWTEVSKRFQRDLLHRVFHGVPVEEFTREFVAALQAGAFDAQLTYKKAIRKELGAYTKTTPPHVKAARKLNGNAGRIVEYVMTRNGPEPLGALTAPPDYGHYIEHQLAPIADAILRFSGADFESIVQSRRQLSLF